MDLNCKSCKQYLKPPIYQCELKNHLFCKECIIDHSLCVYKDCRGSITKLNATFEKLLTQSKHACVHEQSGCKYALHLDQKQQHENECLYRIFKCEFGQFLNINCTWKGKRADLIAHFKQQHSHNVYEYTSDKNQLIIKHLDFTKDQKMIFIVAAHFNFFWFKRLLNTDTQKMYATFQFIGPEKQAHNYYYEMELFEPNNNESIRKYKITELCESDCLNANAIFISGKCFVVPFDVLRSYQQSNGSISYRFRIGKVNNTNKFSSEPVAIDSDKCKQRKNPLTFTNTNFKN